jgi:protein-disulfide isomerase
VPTDATTRTSKRAAARRRIEEKRAAEAAAQARAARRRRTLIGGIAAALAIVIAVVVVIALQSARTSTAADAPVPPHLTDGAIVVGNAAAPVTIDLYEDLQCPICKQFEAQSGRALAGMVSAGTVQLHYHPMAFLDSSANQHYSTRALNAAAAVLDARGPEAFQKFHDVLYANQPPESGPGLTDKQLIDYAAQVGATGTTVQNQIRDLTYGDWAKQVTDQASKDGVTGTPTVFVDGHQLQAADLTPTGLATAVQAAQGG